MADVKNNGPGKFIINGGNIDKKFILDNKFIVNDGNIDKEINAEGEDMYFDSYSVRMQYKKDEFERIVINGDGHCMLNSIIVALKAEKILTKEEVLKKLEKLFLNNYNKYSQYINTEEVDPIKELTEYCHYG